LGLPNPDPTDKSSSRKQACKDEAHTSCRFSLSVCFQLKSIMPGSGSRAWCRDQNARNGDTPKPDEKQRELIPNARTNYRAAMDEHAGGGWNVAAFPD